MTSPTRPSRTGTQLAAATFGLLAAAVVAWSIKILVRYMAGFDLSRWPAESIVIGIVEFALLLAFVGFAVLTFARRRAGTVGLACAGALGFLWVIVVYPIIGHDPVGIYYERLLTLASDFQIFYFLLAVLSAITAVLAVGSLTRTTGVGGQS